MDGESAMSLLRKWKMQRAKARRKRNGEVLDTQVAPVTEKKFQRAPCEPTKAEPGSPEKIEVLRQRYEAGQELWHEFDPYCKSGGEADCSRWNKPSAAKILDTVRPGYFMRHGEGMRFR